MAANDDMLDLIKEGLNDTEEDESSETVDTQEEQNEETQEEDSSNTEEPEENEEQKEPAAGDFDVSKYFEGFESLDEVKQAVERSKEVEQELETLRQSKEELDRLQEQVKALKERQPFNKKEFYQLDKLSEQDPDKAAILTAYKFGDQTAETVLKLRMQFENPDLAEKNPGFFDRQLRKKYPDLYSGDYTPDDVEYMDAKTEMEADAQAARKFLESQLEQVEVPKTKTEEELKAEREQFFKSWQPSFKKVNDELKKFNVSILGEDNKLNSAMEIDIPKKDHKELLEIAANHIANTGIQPSSESIKQAVDVAKAVYLYNHQTEIFTKFANNLLTKGGEEALKKFNNPSKKGADVSVASKTKNKKEASDVIFNDLMGGRKF